MYSTTIEERKSTLKLSDLQRDVLVGILLGDAHLETQNNGRTYRVKFEYSLRHKAYAEHLYGLFREWILTPPQRKTDATHDNVWFQTVSHPAFRFYAHQFVKDRQKCVPKLIHHFLTERGIAYWYMDDGSMKSKESKGVLFNTQGFVKNDVERLVDLLRQRFKLEAETRKQKEGLQIFISGRSYDQFREMVDPFIIPSMRYKVPVERKH